MSIKKNPFKLAVIISTIVCFVCEIIWYFDFFANYGVAYDITTLVHLIPPEIAMTVILVSTLMNKTKVALIATGILYATYFLVSIPSFIDTINGLITFWNAYGFMSFFGEILYLFEFISHIVFIVLVLLCLIKKLTPKTICQGTLICAGIIFLNRVIYSLVYWIVEFQFYFDDFVRMIEWIATCILTICIVFVHSKSLK